ncbi:hypothetical protein BGX31_010306 [Mortierella sp. GBA43]|nr:hypothetical protein BGX31_010306 [Mortierella sp. GBA43]
MPFNTPKAFLKLPPRCTFIPVLGSHLRFSRPVIPRPPIQNRFHNTKSSPSVSSLQSQQDSVPSWTKGDDRMLTVLRRKKSPLEEIQIYMSHQPIEARIKQLDEKAQQKPTFQRWSLEEDELLAKAVKEHGTNNWKDISDAYFSAVPADQSETLQRRSPRSCKIRWKFLHPDALSTSHHSGPWSPEETELFQELVNPQGPNNWEEISRAIGTRSAIQCHSQFKTVMHTGTKGKWTVDEINRLLEARELYGADWQKVSKHVGTRAPGQVRQKWNQFSDDVLRRLEAKRTREDK